jgi:hypothetical protein
MLNQRQATFSWKAKLVDNDIKHFLIIITENKVLLQNKEHKNRIGDCQNLHQKNVKLFAHDKDLCPIMLLIGLEH